MILCNDSGLNVYSIFHPFITTFELKLISNPSSSPSRNRRNYSTSKICKENKISARKLKILAPLYSFHQKLPTSMHGIFDWWLKVGIVRILEFRFPVPLERVQDLGWKLPGEQSVSKQKETYTFLFQRFELVREIVAIHKQRENCER